MRRWAPLLALLCVLSAAPATGAPRLPAVLTQLQPAFQIRPAVISYTGDGTGLLGGVDGTSVRHPGHLHWSVYDAQEGVGHGLLWLNDCTPSCAGGSFHAVAVSVHAFLPKSGHFQRLTLTYTYQGKRYVDRRGIHYLRAATGAGGSWQYYIIGSPS